MHAKILRWSLVSLAGSVALVAFIFAVRDWIARGEATAAIVQHETQRRRLEAELRSAEQRVAVARREQEGLQSTLAAARKKIVAGAQTEMPRKPTAVSAPMAALRDALLNDPHLQNLQLAVVESRLRTTYQPLCEKLRLTNEQITAFLGLLQKREEQEMDLGAILETKGVPDGAAAVSAMRQEMAERFRTAQRALLGETGFREFEAYGRSVPSREFINEYAGAVAVLGAGITAAQADALIDAMANASASYRQGGQATRNFGDIDWDRALSQAATVLSEAQLTVFKNAVTQSRNMDRIRQLARR